jgi:TATA-box binding protein (TBP) (component of TFIID and TFIIIB)
LNAPIPHGIISRFLDIQAPHSTTLRTAAGGIYHVSYVNDYARSEIVHKKRRKEFNNQSTLYFKYHGSHCANIKVFSNGRLELTGIKNEYDAVYISTALIEILKELYITIHYSIPDQQEQMSRMSSMIVSQEYYVVSPTADRDASQLYWIRWYNGAYYNAEQMLHLLEELCSYVEKFRELMQQLNKCSENMSTTPEYISELYSGMRKILVEFYSKVSRSGFKYDEVVLDEIAVESISDIMKDVIGCETGMRYVINRMRRVYDEDISVLVDIIALLANRSQLPQSLGAMGEGSHPQQLVVRYRYNGLMCSKQQYSVSDVRTHLINCDYRVSCYINLQRVSEVLGEVGFYCYYNPNSYNGVLVKFYYNVKNRKQGVCECVESCKMLGKRSICDKITVSIFRSGSILITSAKTVAQVQSVYSVINDILRVYYDRIKSVQTAEDKHLNAFNNNMMRKLGKKQCVYYVPRSIIATTIPAHPASST